MTYKPLSAVTALIAADELDEEDDAILQEVDELVARCRALLSKQWWMIRFHLLVIIAHFTYIAYSLWSG